MNASYLSWLPESRSLFAVATTQDKSPLLNAYQWNTSTQSFDLSQSLGLEGRGICHINTNKARTKLAIANYSSGDFQLFDISDGSLKNKAVFKNTGKSITKRQTSPHAHYVGWGRGSRYLYATDLGTDEILVFDTSTDDFSPIQRVKADAGDGPRHLDFHPSLGIVYSLNELSNSISIFSSHKETGYLSLLDKVYLSPKQQKGVTNTASAIRISKQGNYVYVAVRGENMIYGLKITPDGRLSIVNKVSSGGNHPRDFNFSPNEDYLMVANQRSNQLNVVKRDENTGRLFATDVALSIVTPSFVQAFGN
ncbi:lactonase family protein [Agaribacter flavus]|uniref:Lactonase family protein n=1 Tax=Agaribacter flavus TaxID=1902781 RepID=A0ABV7FVI6_9ALTE